MRKLIAAAAVLALLLAGCSGGKTQTVLTPEERTQLYETAITSARDQETNEALPLITGADDELADLIFTLLGVSDEDMTAYALSVSPMNVRAYAVAAILPAAGKDETVLEGLHGFIDNQKQSFEQYLADQYDIAVNARLETLEDGTLLLCMCENQDAVFDAVRDAIEAAK